MPIDEVFANPPVKEVAFELRFPKLFFLEGRMGDFQLAVMKDFPDSELLLQRHIVFAKGVGDKEMQEAIEKAAPEDPVQKIWQFKSAKGVTVKASIQSLAILSDKHTSYNRGESNRFRDIIEAVTTAFFAVTKVPIASRVGMRYINHCAVPAKETTNFREHYNTSFPLDRFPLETATTMRFSADMQRNGCQLRYIELLKASEGEPELILDFDAWAVDVEAEKTLEVADRLHATIVDEFDKTMKEPARDIMRRVHHVNNE